MERDDQASSRFLSALRMRAQLIRNGTSSLARLRGFWDTPPTRYHLPRDIRLASHATMIDRVSAMSQRCLSNISAMSREFSTTPIWSCFHFCAHQHNDPHEAGSRLNDPPQTSSIWMWSRSYATSKSLITLRLFPCRLFLILAMQSLISILPSCLNHREIPSDRIGF